MERRGIKRRLADDEESSTDRKMHLDTIYKRISLDKRDKKASKALVHKVLSDILTKVCKQEGGHIYKQIYVDAGSHPVNAKIGTANEFDVNIPMTLKPTVRREGRVIYHFEDSSKPGQGASTSSMTKERQLVENFEIGHIIPEGYCIVSVDDDNTLPDKFIHTKEYLPGWIINGSSVDQIDVIPYDVKLDLYEKLSRAINTDKVSLSRSPSGPALTLTIKPQTNIKHRIDVDVTASIIYSIPLTSWIKWPRQSTLDAFDPDLLRQTMEAGTHLVPKKDLVWAISFSRMERVLPFGMDGDRGCRKFVYKMLKKYVDDCKTKIDLPGISSHILKTQLLWSCELHAYDKNYWAQEKMDVCLMNTMHELETTLNSGIQKDYFHVGLDVLNGKDPGVLLQLARFIQKRRIELLRM